MACLQIKGELTAVVLADLHRSQISLVCYPTITKHVYFGLLAYFHIYTYIFQTQLVAYLFIYFLLV